MSAAYPKPSALQRPIFVVALVIASGIDIYLQSHVVSRFREIYRDALPGQLLPAITHFVLNFQTCLIILPIFFLIAGVWIAFRAKPIWLVGIVFGIAIQIAFTIIALFMPLNTLITGMPSPS